MATTSRGLKCWYDVGQPSASSQHGNTIEPMDFSLCQLLQVEKCDSNSRLVVDEDDQGKFSLEMIKPALV